MAYKSSVLVNNWYEEVCANEEKHKIFLTNWFSENLLVQKTQDTFFNFYKPVRLNPKSDFLPFNSIVQLVCKNIPHTNYMKNYSELKTPTLAIVIAGEKVHTSQNINKQCELSIAMATGSYVRNTFRIVSPDGKKKSDEYLRFGENFCLECIEADEPHTVVYCAPVATEIVDTKFQIFNKRSECSLGLGLISKKNIGKDCVVPSYYTFWNCKSTSPGNRNEKIGSHVPTGGPVIICNTATGKYLAGENIIQTTLFGPEYLVMVNNYTDNYRREHWQNIWQICVGSGYQA